MNQQDGVKLRLFQVGTELFAEKGYDSVSVREICKQAGTSMNMIHHYFGNKEGLFNEIVSTFTEKVFAFPLRLLEKEVHSKEEFTNRIELFFEETLTALIEHRSVLHIMTRHDIEASAMSKLIQTFVKFLGDAQKQGFVQKGFEPEMVSGFVMDRLATQVLYAPQIAKYSEYDLIGDAAYRARWVRSNLNLFLYGLVDRE